MRWKQGIGICLYSGQSEGKRSTREKVFDVFGSNKVRK